MLTGIRYMALLLAIIVSALDKQIGTNININFVSLFLLFAINNQVRFFSLTKKRAFYTASLTVEIILAAFIFNSYGGALFFLLFSVLLDSTMNINNRYISSGFVLIMIAELVIFEQVFDVALVLNILSIVTIGALSSFIKDETERKLEAQKLYDKLRISEEELKNAKEELERYASTVEEITLLRERNRISREIHDSVGHSLSTMIIQLSAIEKSAQSNGQAASEMAAGLTVFAKEALSNVRAAVRALKPAEFEKYQGVLAIEEMIRNFKKLTDVDVIFTLSKNRGEFNSDQSFIIYRIVQEFLTNAVRHGKASKVNINLNFFQDSLYMRLKDNGKGCKIITEGLGLKNIKERVSSQGGTAEYSSSEGNGFELNLTLPSVLGERKKYGKD
jgi:signal transduction histidine kinase